MCSKESSASIYSDLLKSLGQITVNLCSLRFPHFSFRLCSPWTSASRALPWQEQEGTCLYPLSAALFPHPGLYSSVFTLFFFHLLLLHWKTDTTVIKNKSTKEIKATTIKVERKGIPVNIYQGRVLLQGREQCG